MVVVATMYLYCKAKYVTFSQWFALQSPFKLVTFWSYEVMNFRIQKQNEWVLMLYMQEHHKTVSHISGKIIAGADTCPTSFNSSFQG